MQDNSRSSSRQRMLQDTARLQTQTVRMLMCHQTRRLPVIIAL